MWPGVLSPTPASSQIGRTPDRRARRFPCLPGYPRLIGQNERSTDGCSKHGKGQLQVRTGHPPGSALTSGLQLAENEVLWTRQLLRPY